LNMLNAVQRSENEFLFNDFFHAATSTGSMNWVATDSCGRGLLHFAAQYGMPRVAEVALSKGCMVDAQDSNMCTPLHYAVFNGERDVVELLLRYNARVTIPDCNNETVVQLAQAIPDRDDILPLLMDARNRQANVSAQQPIYQQPNVASPMQQYQQPGQGQPSAMAGGAYNAPPNMNPYGAPQQGGTSQSPGSPVLGNSADGASRGRSESMWRSVNKPGGPGQPGSPQPSPALPMGQQPQTQGMPPPQTQVSNVPPTNATPSNSAASPAAGAGNSNASPFGPTAFSTATPIPQNQRANLTTSGGANGNGASKRDRGLSGLINSVKKAFGSTLLLPQLHTIEQCANECFILSLV
jgi:hypothetical protein